MIHFGDFTLGKKEWQSSSKCIQNEDKFEYFGIPNAVCGRTIYYDENEREEGEGFISFRIKVIQMKE